MTSSGDEKGSEPFSATTPLRTERERGGSSEAGAPSMAAAQGSDHPPAPRAGSDPFLELRADHLRSPVHLFALGFGAGLAPRAPGTAGSLVALPIAWLMLGWSFGVRAAIVAALFAIGIWICGESARRLRTHDHPGIVFDEIVGLLATSLVLSGNPLWLLAAFVAFRLFDIVKPWPIRDLDHRLAGGLGIMLDDLMAAVYAAAALAGLRYLLSLI